MTQPLSSDTYFEHERPPATIQSDREKVADFVSRQRQAGRKVVLVTSGGTTVPLERNMVRFLDNFSAGTRGATSAEYFLEAGYAVIFLHRQFSLQPFSRHYSHSTNPFLELLTVETDQLDIDSNAGTPVPKIAIVPEARPKLLSVLAAYRECHAKGTLLTLNFVTVNDYLWLLRTVSVEMAALGRRAIFYLAAAVSDFFLPTQKMVEHKIQSGEGNLQLEMDQVPKILKPLVSQWTREGFIVSFKLETDPALLIPKARGALERYGHQVVIANDLHRRKFEVAFVSRLPTAPSSTGSSAPSVQFVEEWLTLPTEDVDAGKEIEVDIVARLVTLHEAWIEKGTVAINQTPEPNVTSDPQVAA
ncbi:hypothetical protein M407DRAFT_247026 [Tulasnella calospora MUT 4182]|uniref:DNA/pantothenate metabolism flavoprotein C-terminal domain-containing protein n=1 Tax=Tulasnella calospora MUT 4182 TaxID=1051891 RepID=A0A0C3Q173_9AGAM|nr:hypothetical protein M407DRAFT_247026 [Tulasnella calospora MUT 4182]